MHALEKNSITRERAGKQRDKLGGFYGNPVNLVDLQ